MMVNLTMLVRDRLNLTRQTLDTMAMSGSLEGNVLTILDDRSLDPTRLFLEDWAAQHQAHLVRNDEPLGTGEARNRVVQAAEQRWGRGHLLYLSDNDLAYSRDWLPTLIGMYRLVSPLFLVLGAYNHPFNQPVRTYLAGHQRVSEVMALAGQSMLMSWKTWDRYGPFIKTPVDKVCQSEDVMFSQRINGDGHKVGVASPWLAIGTGITNTFGEHIPGWEMVKSQCPKELICE